MNREKTAKDAECGILFVRFICLLDIELKVERV